MNMNYLVQQYDLGQPIIQTQMNPTLRILGAILCLLMLVPSGFGIYLGLQVPVSNPFIPLAVMLGGIFAYAAYILLHPQSLALFQQGLVYRFGDRYRVMRYTEIVSVREKLWGRGTEYPYYGYQIKAESGQSLGLDSFQLGRLLPIASVILQVLISQNRGSLPSFGLASLNSTGLQWGRKTFPWAEIASIQALTGSDKWGYLDIYKTLENQKIQRWQRIDLNRIPNSYSFLYQLILHLHQHYRFQYPNQSQEVVAALQQAIPVVAGQPLALLEALFQYSQVIECNGDSMTSAALQKQLLSIQYNPLLSVAFETSDRQTAALQLMQMGSRGLQPTDRTGSSVVEHLLDEAQQLIRQSDFWLAIEKQSQATRLQPDSWNAYFARAITRRFVGDFEGAIADYTHILRRYPNDASSYANRGLAYASLGNLQAAREDLQQAIALFRRTQDNNANIQELQTQLENLTHQPDATPPLRTIDFYFQRGYIRRQDNDLEGAIADFSQVLQMDSSHAMAYNARGSAYADLEEGNRAMADFEQALQIQPNFEQVYYHRGNLHQHQGNHQAAIQDYTQAIDLKPDYAKAYGNRGNAYQILGNDQAAIQNYDQAIRLQPTAIDYLNRGVSHQRLGQFNPALQDFDSAIQLAPNFAPVYELRGMLRSSRGDLQQGISDLQIAAQLYNQAGQQEKYQALLHLLQDVSTT